MSFFMDRFCKKSLPAASNTSTCTARCQSWRAWTSLRVARPMGSSRSFTTSKYSSAIRRLYIRCHSCPFVVPSTENTMPKIDVSKVAEILKKNHIDPAVLRRVVEEMNLAVQPDPGDEDKPPAVKKQYVIVVSD